MDSILTTFMCCIVCWHFFLGCEDQTISIKSLACVHSILASFLGLREALQPYSSRTLDSILMGWQRKGYTLHIFWCSKHVLSTAAWTILFWSLLHRVISMQIEFRDRLLASQTYFWTYLQVKNLHQHDKTDFFHIDNLVHLVLDFKKTVAQRNIKSYDTKLFGS